MRKNPYREKIDLAGTWRFRVRDGKYTERIVPGSYRCCGVSEYTRRFSFVPRAGKRVILCTEGINYRGRICLNGQVVGTTVPYCHDRFDVTSYILEENELTVTVEDLPVTFGFTDGWCGYSGIIRAIYLEIVAETALSDVWFRQTLDESLSHAACTVELQVEGKEAQACTARITLSKNGKKVASTEGKGTLTFSVDTPELWSPASPALYELKTELLLNGEVIDGQISEVGFRVLRMDDHRFYLNGEPFFFAGVCRHDLGTDEQGQTLSDEALEKDMRMIKELGVNFVRLVHYPHDERVVEWADRLGLFISEESGLWWSDITNRELTEGALEVLRRTILRDRSHPCVAFWMSFNECIFTHEFLVDSVKVCREYDPDRFVSGASCMMPSLTKEMFDAAGIDFYTFHPYGFDPAKVTGGFLPTGGSSPQGASLEATMRQLSGKPLIFSEWGGAYVVDNPTLFTRFLETLKYGKEQGILAGEVYWSFADMYEFNRAKPCAVDGVQVEGLVTIDREPKVDYYVYQKFLRELDQPLPTMIPTCKVEAYSLEAGETSVAIPLIYPDTEEQHAAWNAATEDSALTRGIFRMRRKRYIKEGPQLPEAVGSLGDLHVEALQKPVAISEHFPSYTVTVDQSGSKLVLLGNALYLLGCPVYGEYGEECARLTLCYSDGSDVAHPLRNGIELLTATTLHCSSRIDPISPVLENAITFTYEPSFEHYRIYTLTLPLDPEKILESVRIESCMQERCVLLYGMSILKK